MSSLAAGELTGRPRITEMLACSQPSMMATASCTTRSSVACGGVRFGEQGAGDRPEGLGKLDLSIIVHRFDRTPGAGSAIPAPSNLLAGSNRCGKSLTPCSKVRQSRSADSLAYPMVSCWNGALISSSRLRSALLTERGVESQRARLKARELGQTGLRGHIAGADRRTCSG